MDNKEAAITPAAAQQDDLESGAAGGSPARRRLLTAGFAGAAMSLLPWLNGRASAGTDNSTGDTTDGTTADTTAGDSDTDEDGDVFAPDTTGATDITTGGTENSTELTDPSGDTSITQAPTGDAPGGTEAPAPTTTIAPVRHPTADDMVLLDFAQSVELTARDLYDVAIDAGVFDSAVAADMIAIREAHEGYATAISGLIGRQAANKANSGLFDAMSADFEGDPADVATAAAALEDAAVATHIDLIGELVGTDGSSLIASIVVIESRIATLLRAISGVEDLEAQLEFEADALSPSDYPVE